MKLGTSNAVVWSTLLPITAQSTNQMMINNAQKTRLVQVDPCTVERESVATQSCYRATTLIHDGLEPF